MKNLEHNLGYKFLDTQLLRSALHHSSLKQFASSFERLEFLGDRILGVVIAEYIFTTFKGLSEGGMSKMHSAFVCADTCYQIALSIGVDKVIQTAGVHLKTNKTVLADAMEAILGALFIDSDYQSAKRIILNLWNKAFDKYDESAQEPKTRLQEICQEKTHECPVYNLISVTGPDHNPEFTVQLSALGCTIKAKGHSRKDAETIAAKTLLKKLLRCSDDSKDN